MSPPEAIPNDVTPFHMTEEQQCQAIRDRIHMVVNGYRNTVPPTHITRKKYRIRFLPVSLIAACLAVGFSEREIINVHLYFLIAVPVLGYYVFKQVQSGDTLTTRLEDGWVESQVTGITPVKPVRKRKVAAKN